MGPNESPFQERHCVGLGFSTPILPLHSHSYWAALLADLDIACVPFFQSHLLSFNSQKVIAQQLLQLAAYEFEGIFHQALLTCYATSF